MPATSIPAQYPFTDRPRYNDYIVARVVAVPLGAFVPDPDWRTTPSDDLLLDGQGVPVMRFQVPLISGEKGAGWAFTVVGIDNEGSEVDPTGGTITVEAMEVVSYSGNYQTKVPHVCAISELDLTNPFNVANNPVGGSVEFNRIVRLLEFGGGQNQFVFRITALTPPAGAVLVRLLVKPLGT